MAGGAAQKEAKGEPDRAAPVRRIQATLWYVIALVLLGATVWSYMQGLEQQLTYSAWWQAVAEGRVETALVSETEITGKLKPPAEAPEADAKAEEGGEGATDAADAPLHYRVEMGGIHDDKLWEHLRSNGVAYDGERRSMLGEWLLYLALPLAAMVVFWIFLMRRLGSGNQSVLSLGRSKAKIVAETDVQTTFQDVAGVEEAVEEVHEIVEFLKNPEKFRRLGAKIPKGILLIGLPGTGKTLLARALAGESGVPFFHLSGSDFVEMFAGLGAARVRDLFQQAKQKAPCIIFIDEIDALGKTRSVASLSGHEEREQTLNALLVEMDGFETNTGVVLMAATNRPEILDRALLRPGRFDRQVVVDRPDQAGRLQILKAHARDKKLAPGADLEVVAKRTVGLVGADLANILNEAALLAGRAGRSEVRLADIEEAIDRVMAGLEKKRRILTPEEREIVAHHEAGHAILAQMLPGADRVHKVSIVPRGVAALGFTVQLPSEDRYLQRRTELLDRLCVLLGGRAAEDIQFSEVTTGAQNDLDVATGFARRMVGEYGMSERLGLTSYSNEPGPRYLGDTRGRDRLYSEETAREIDLEIKRILDEQYARAKNLLVDHQHALGRIARRLLEVEVIDREELERLLHPGQGKPGGDAGEKPEPERASTA